MNVNISDIFHYKHIKNVCKALHAVVSQLEPIRTLLQPFFSLSVRSVTRKGIFSGMLTVDLSSFHSFTQKSLQPMFEKKMAVSYGFVVELKLNFCFLTIQRETMDK